MTAAKVALAVLLLLCMGAQGAQNNSTDIEPDNREVLRMGLFPPDIIMRQQQRLGITADQRRKIASEVRDFQGEVTELQWAMPNEQQKLQQLLSTSQVDAEPALAQAEKVLRMEGEFKLAHFRLLIAIKNVLTDEQVQKLNTAIRRRVQQAKEDRSKN